MYSVPCGWQFVTATQSYEFNARGLYFVYSGAGVILGSARPSRALNAGWLKRQMRSQAGSRGMVRVSKKGERAKETMLKKKRGERNRDEETQNGDNQKTGESRKGNSAGKQRLTTYKLG